MNRIAVILVIIFSGFLFQSHSLFNKTEKDNWEIHESDAFRIFYVNSEEEARESAEFLENEFDRITELIGFIPIEKTEIYLVPKENKEIKIPKSEEVGIVVLENNSLENILVMEFTECLLFNMYSRKVRKYLDPWFISGVSGYVAGLDVDPASVAQTTFEPVNLEVLEGEDAGIAGYMIWNYLVKMNGEGVIAHILNNARILKSDRGAIEQFVGIPFEMVMNNCKKYYYD